MHEEEEKYKFSINLARFWGHESKWAAAAAALLLLASVSLSAGKKVPGFA